MAKRKIKSIKPINLSGYGLKSPWEFVPGDSDEPRGVPQSGCGDYFGTGIKNPVGTVRDMAGVNPVSKEKLRNPPRSLA